MRAELCSLAFVILFGTVASNQVCESREGLPGKCIPSIECHDKSLGLPVCRKIAFFYIVCCPIKRTTVVKEHVVTVGQGPAPIVEQSTPRPDPLAKLNITGCGNQFNLNANLHEEESMGQVFAAVGGEIAGIEAWPWMAAIFRRPSRGGKIDTKEIYCGGTIINNRYIISAAHCFRARQGSRLYPEKYIVMLGVNDINDTENADKYLVEDIIVHEEFLPPVEYNDIALLKLDSPIQFKRTVKPVCLPIGHAKTINLEKHNSVITGWGTTTFGGRGSQDLIEVYLPVTSNAECDASYKKVNTKRKYPRGIMSTMICAGLKEGGKDACQGDSGGPLVWHDFKNYKWILIGIVSGGYQCARADFPGVYTRVTEYLPWIAENI